MTSIYSTQSKALAARLQKARKAAGFNQERAAKALRKSQSYISKIENGQLRLDVVQLRAFALLYRVSISVLIG